VKKLILLMLALMLMITAAGCMAAEDTPSQADEDTSLLEIMEKSKLVIGYEETSYPFFYKDGADTFSGIEAEIIKEVCKRLILDYEFKQVDASESVGQLMSGKIDLLWGNIKRNEYDDVGYSDAFFKCETPVLLLRNDSKIDEVSELKDEKVGYLNLSRSGIQVNRLEGIAAAFAAYTSYKNMDDAVQDLLDRKLEAVVMDSVTAIYYTGNHPKDTFKSITEGLSAETDEFSIGFNPLRARLNQKIKEVTDLLLKDKTLEYFSNEQFGRNIIVLPPLTENPLFTEGTLSPYISSDVSSAAQK